MVSCRFVAIFRIGFCVFEFCAATNVEIEGKNLPISRTYKQNAMDILKRAEDE